MTYLYSRDLQTRLEELEVMDEAWRESQVLPMEEAPLDPDELEELEELRTLSEEVADWQYGATLIPKDDFELYARELAEDTGAIPADATWPLTWIDWECAARELAYDYSLVEYQSSSYYVRN